MQFLSPARENTVDLWVVLEVLALVAATYGLYCLVAHLMDTRP